MQPVAVPFPPVEPPKAHVRFPSRPRRGASDVVAVGCEFSPGTLLLAYRSGIFPWPHSGADHDAAEPGEGPAARSPLVLWFSPDPRAIFPLEGELHWSRSLRRTLRTHPYEVTFDEAFAEVMRACGEARAGGTWIIPELISGYEALHALGWAHSVEVWERTPAGRTLVGGIYGVSIGGLFAGESMFHRRTDTSKIAFATLAQRLKERKFGLFDVQVQNPHLASLGVVEISREAYLGRLAEALEKQPRLV